MLRHLHHLHALLLRLLRLRTISTDLGHCLVIQDQRRRRAQHGAVLIDRLVEVDLVEHLGLGLCQLASKLHGALNARNAHHLHRLRHHADVLDRQVHALELFRWRRNHLELHHDVERAVDQRIEQLVVQALKHWPQHQELLFVALLNLARRDV